MDRKKSSVGFKPTPYPPYNRSISRFLKEVFVTIWCLSSRAKSGSTSWLARTRSAGRRASGKRRRTRSSAAASSSPSGGRRSRLTRPTCKFFGDGVAISRSGNHLWMYDLPTFFILTRLYFLNKEIYIDLLLGIFCSPLSPNCRFEQSRNLNKNELIATLINRRFIRIRAPFATYTHETKVALKGVAFLPITQWLRVRFSAFPKIYFDAD